MNQLISVTFSLKIYGKSKTAAKGKLIVISFNHKAGKVSAKLSKAKTIIGNITKEFHYLSTFSKMKLTVQNHYYVFQYKSNSSEISGVERQVIQKLLAEQIM